MLLSRVRALCSSPPIRFISQPIRIKFGNFHFLHVNVVAVNFPTVKIYNSKCNLPHVLLMKTIGLQKATKIGDQALTLLFWELFCNPVALKGWLVKGGSPWGRKINILRRVPR